MQAIDYLDKGAAIEPNRACLIDDNGTRSYAEVQAMSHRIANAFRREGIPLNVKAAVYSGNSARVFECIVGILRAGCVWTTVNARNLIEDTIHILNNTDTEVLFFSAKFADHVARLRIACPRVKTFICIDGQVADAICFDDWIAGLPDTSPEIIRSPDDLVIMLSSGGTTGKPKGVLVTQLNWEIMTHANYMLFCTGHPVHLIVGPMSHAAGGLAMSMMPMGPTHIVLPGFDAVRVLETIEKARVTHVFLPPTMIYMLLAHPDVRKYDYSSLKFLAYAAAPMAVDKLKEAIEVFGPVLAQSYGQTETGQGVVFFSPEDHMEALRSGNERRLSSCGREMLVARVEIMDDDGNILPPETPGEIVMRATSVTPGYYKNPDETAIIQKFGWHHTGDIGIKDEDGWLYVVDRKKDMIISGGFNIYSAEIEKAILGHPAVQDCAVIGVPDEKWGEAVKAVVQMKPGQAFDAEALNQFCRKQLSGYMVPKSFEAWEDLPRSAAGKVLKKEIRAKFWEGRARQI